MKFTAINIGPVISTLGMARRPRELWAASYLFSHLMKCIYAEAKKCELTIVSPAEPEEDAGKVGLYPDRLYIRGEVDARTVLTKALGFFCADLHGQKDSADTVPDLNYFNLMSVTCEAEKESEAVRLLNHKLDVMELCQYAADSDAAQTIRAIVTKKLSSPLFELATGKDRMIVPELEDIAHAQCIVPGVKEKSHHRYFCVVQADGDNFGKTVTNPGLKDGEIRQISKKLMDFGLCATAKIEEFGGFPVYAGGDDLLFIAPVVGKTGDNIFNLLDIIENDAFKGVVDKVNQMGLKDKDGNPIEASLSFGVSITYYKYPLYEALESARTLLFKNAKKQKPAVAWSLRKHSGGTFDATLSLKNADLKERFVRLIEATTDRDTVSAVAHKLREADKLVDIVLESGQPDRLDALFDKILEFDRDKADYFNAIKDIMPVLYKTVGKNEFIQTLYSLLRTARFLKGEDIREEDENE